jgi:ribosomal RNA-processing protein 12
LNPAFSQLLSQLLYSQSELRPAILKALKILVDSNLAISASNAPLTSLASLTPQEAAANVAFLRTQVESWLAVLFNVFGSNGRDSRGMIGDVITAWASIGEEQVCINVVNTVFDPH